MNQKHKQYKSYFYAPAYSNNYHFFVFVDGKITINTIVSYHELDGFIYSLETQGYEYKMYVEYYRHQYETALEAYQSAKNNLTCAEQNALYVDEKSKIELNRVLF